MRLVSPVRILLSIFIGSSSPKVSANALPLPGTLIRPSPFSNPDIDEKIMGMGINVVINPTSQFQLSGGSVHCVTNEL